MRPSSVLIPVANTTASASPSVHNVPATTSSCASNGDAAALATASRATGRDSPSMGTYELPQPGEPAHPPRHDPPNATTSPGRSRVAFDIRELSVAAYLHVWRQELAQRLRGPLRLRLLKERHHTLIMIIATTAPPTSHSDDAGDGSDCTDARNNQGHDPRVTLCLPPPTSSG
jgi:hypothetical protein